MKQQQVRKIELVIPHPEHLETHRQEFIIPLDEVLDIVREILSEKTPNPGFEDVFVYKTPYFVGMGGLATIHFWTTDDYWNYRKERTILSHLIKRKRPKIKTICIWGYWETENKFLLHTVYPGNIAPREIHDPELTPETMREAVRFWSKHAIIVDK